MVMSHCQSLNTECSCAEEMVHTAVNPHSNPNAQLLRKGTDKYPSLASLRIFAFFLGVFLQGMYYSAWVFDITYAHDTPTSSCVLGICW